MLAADESDPAPWLCAVVPAHACFPWTNQPPHSFVGSLKKKQKKQSCFIAKHRSLILKRLNLKRLLFVSREEPYGGAFHSKTKRPAASKLTSPLDALILISILSPGDTKHWHFGGFNHPCIFNSYHRAVIYFQNRLQEALWEREDSYVVQLQLWSVIADGYQCFPLIWAQRGKKIPPVGGRYLLPLFGASSCWRLKVGASFHSELIGVFGSSAKEKWVSRALVVFLNERCWLSWKSVFGITNTSLTNLRNFVSKCVFFSIGSRPSSLWMFDLDTWQVVRLSRSHRSVTSVQLSPCSCLDVDALMCKARVTKAAGHEAEEIQKWNVGCSRKVDINTDAKFLGILFLLCLYCNFFVLNIAERCVVIPSLWWITLYSTSSVEPAKLQQKQKFKISIDFPSVLLLQMEF